LYSFLDNSNNIVYAIVGSSVGLLVLSAGSIFFIRKRRSRLAEQRMQGRYESMLIQHQLEQNMRQNPLAVDGDGSVWSFFESESNYIS
jgi:LPXTG-motif cell wall-anchored protein